MIDTLMKDRVLTLTPNEHTELLGILEQAYLNLRVEVRCTGATNTKLAQKETITQRLLEKVRQLG